MESDPNMSKICKEYKQLPEDSQFIEKHYDELIFYKDIMLESMTTNGKEKEKFDKDHNHDHGYMVFESASNLFLHLSKLKPETLGVELIKYDKFVRDLTITLKLNGGHLFILDLLIQNKQMFDDFEKDKIKNN
ncbi:unnamed protein product [Ambrosiozyma monospora]|uniref:Unnamed protein product n=1 Tax=Ambrosiozyma monospora TaxID=43982 RepID=A0A9W6Z8U3_AMBMO|nr:unnamed protein product [Ambrosiozyma monospora]